MKFCREGSNILQKTSALHAQQAAGPTVQCSPDEGSAARPQRGKKDHWKADKPLPSFIRSLTGPLQVCFEVRMPRFPDIVNPGLSEWVAVLVQYSLEVPLLTAHLGHNTWILPGSMAPEADRSGSRLAVLSFQSITYSLCIGPKECSTSRQASRKLTSRPDGQLLSPRCFCDCMQMQSTC